MAAEEYDFGNPRAFHPARRQAKFGTIDFNGKPVNAELGVGLCMTPATDRFALKLILSRDL